MPASQKHQVNVTIAHPTAIPRRPLALAVRAVLSGERIPSATISVAVVDDATIHELNRRYLEHDYPTDVLSFTLSDREEHLEGEIVVSVDRAVELAPSYGWPAESELALYVIHGMLHLAGYDDHKPADRARMRDRERHYLEQLGIAITQRLARRKSTSPRKKRR